MPADPPIGAHVTYTQQFRRCGKTDCPACTAGKPGHGPYWYAYWREDGRVRTRYMGQQAPIGAEPAPTTTSEEPNQGPRTETAPDTLRVRTLGAFEVRRGLDPIPADRWSRRQGGALFKCLLGTPGHRLHREQAIEMLWPDADPEVGAANLRLAVHALRAGIDGPESTHLQTTDQWLVLIPAPGREVPADWLDADAFLRIGARALAGRDTATCRAALALYAGDYLPEDLYEEWVVGRREELGLLHLAVLLHQAELYTEQGNTRGALRALRKLLEADPCHEAAARAMMRLHAVGGRRTEAIRVYHRFAAALRRELDLEPEPDTQALFQALQHQTLPAPAAPAMERVLAGLGTAGAVSGARSVHTNLPSVLSSFVGREEAVAELSRLLARSRSSPRLLTLTGVGGCGKTRLALQVASGPPARYRDGVWLVELAGLGDPALVVSAVASVVGMQEKAVISPAAGSSALSTALIATLRDKQLLLVLDNCEHLRAACADLAARLLDGCPGVRMLATSREPLRVMGEVVWRVPPLACPDPPTGDDANLADLLRVEAVSLFTARARIGRPGFTLTSDNALPVARICRCLDGIPLAIELAVARLGSISVEGIAARLETSFRLLAGEAGRGLPRQQTMRAAMDWSYALLSEAERVLFRRLSAFAGGWTLEAAQAVCADEDGGALEGGLAVGPEHEPGSGVEPEEMLDGLVRLVAKSLVARDELVPADGVVRYRLLEPVRQYAAEALAANGETGVLQRRH